MSDAVKLLQKRILRNESSESCEPSHLRGGGGGGGGFLEPDCISLIKTNF